MKCQEGQRRACPREPCRFAVPLALLGYDSTIVIRKAADDVTDMTGAPSRAGAQAPWSASELLVLALGVGLYLGWRTIDISPTLFPPAHTGVEEALTGASYVGTALSIVVFLGVMRVRRRFGIEDFCPRATI